MKILTTIVMGLTLLIMSGCASRYTSIKETNVKNQYIITEVHERPFGLSSEIHVCEAKSNTELECKKLN